MNGILKYCFSPPRSPELDDSECIMSSIRSPETKEPSVEFDVSLLEETENLQANEILWNNLTADTLQAL
uniref:Uncharacterized protein n=1 Tax=Anguilla anguilla TaxID=7936 RepID=A0A0E9TC40_ANGAN